jgi:hypothetical protein
MTPLNQFLEIIKKHGAMGVLALWLSYTHFEVQDLKARLFACLDKENGIQQNKKTDPMQQKAAAILPTDLNKRRKLA